MAKGFMIFHLNLAFSSIRTESRPEVIRKCYWPLLELIDRAGIPIGIELTGWTLQQIHKIAPDWVSMFRRMLHQGQCELIGSGWSQIIGPLVPYEVNRWNQQLGLNAYQSALGVKPGIALVNEMAFSSGLVDIYSEAGYAGIVMDRDNVRLALNLTHVPIAESPTHALGCHECKLPLLWADSILFQRLQRAVHGDISIEEYSQYVAARVKRDHVALPIYCNDAEIFDYRPGRFTTEAQLHPEGEWNRLESVLRQMSAATGLAWISPSQALLENAQATAPRICRLTTAAHPIPVKKQAKYNINRWSVTGRNDLWLNTACHRLYRHMRAETYSELWQKLCELWASDLRTHIVEERWQNALNDLGELSRSRNILLPTSSAQTATDEKAGEYLQPYRDWQTSIEPSGEGIYWKIETPYVHATLNIRRGMTIHALGFVDHAFTPIVGSLPQGHFDSIDLGADFYSGGIVIELPSERKRLTDLEWVRPKISQDKKCIKVSCTQDLGEANITKTLTIHKDSAKVELDIQFGDAQRPLGTVRAPILTIMTDNLGGDLTVQCNNGGPCDESFRLDESFDQGSAVSPLISSHAAYGATTGVLAIQDNKGVGCRMTWAPHDCAVAPLVKFDRRETKSLLRIFFSLNELDDTFTKGGHLLSPSITIEPCAPSGAFSA